MYLYFVSAQDAHKNVAVGTSVPAALVALDRGNGICATWHTSSAFGLGKSSSCGGCA
jgi:hypothetical protein